MEPIRKTPARVTLNVDVVEKLRSVSSQLETEFKGILHFKRDDIVNIILDLRCQQFSEVELNQIRNKRFTNKKRAEWLLKLAEESEKAGDEVSFDDLIKQLKNSKLKKKEKKKPVPSTQGANESIVD